MIRVGRYALALDFAQRELVLVQRQVAPADLQIARTLERLGDIFTTLHRVQEATTHYEEALVICTANGEAGATLKKNVEQSIRWLRIQSGLAAESGEDTAKKNKLDSGINEPDQSGSFEDFCARCMSYLNAGALQEANDLVQRMVDGSRRYSDPSERVSILQFAGSIWHRLGKYSEAEQAYLEALHTLEASETDDPKRGEDYQIISLIYHNLGGLYYETGRVAESERMRRRSRQLAHSTSLDNPDALVL